MRIATCLIIVLALVTVTAGQESASCIVSITADPGIVPLNANTVRSLIYSSAVAGKAGHDVLGADGARNFEGNIAIEWLAQDGTQAQAGTHSAGRLGSEGQDDFLMQLQAIYGNQYVGQTKQSSPKDPASERGGDQQAPPRMRGAGGTGGGVMGAGGMGGMGGMMGAGGMGGTGAMMGGGGMGGYGIGMRDGAYGTPSGATSATVGPQTATLRLSVQLPAGAEREEGQSVADDLLNALLENLRQTLMNAHGAYAMRLNELVEAAESRREEADRNFAIATGRYAISDERQQIEEQLEMFVDLSMLSPEMPFSEAIQYIKNAVEPPLPIVVLWKELLDNCKIEPSSPIDMDGLSNVKLGAALKTLLQAVGGGFADVSYQIDDGVIIVREEKGQNPVTLPSIETDARDLAMRRRELMYRLQQLEMDFAITKARREAIEEQIARVRHETDRKIEEDTVTREMQKLLELSQQHLDTLTKQVDAGRLPEVDLAKARENVTRAKIELARRREELAGSAGGSQLNQFNNELSQMAIETAAKRAELEFLRRQLAETEVEFARASTFDPQAAQIRIAKQALEVAEAQVSRLRAQLAGLQPPTVTVIGAN